MRCVFFSISKIFLYFFILCPLSWRSPQVLRRLRQMSTDSGGPTFVADRGVYFYRLNFHSIQLVVSGIAHFSELMLLYSPPSKTPKESNAKNYQIFLPFPIFGNLGFSVILIPNSEYEICLTKWGTFTEIMSTFAPNFMVAPIYSATSWKFWKFWAKIVKFLVKMANFFIFPSAALVGRIIF